MYATRSFVNLCVCMHIHICVFYGCTCISTRMHIFICVYLCVHMQIHVQICIGVYVYREWTCWLASGSSKEYVHKVCIYAWWHDAMTQLILILNKAWKLQRIWIPDLKINLFCHDGIYGMLYSGDDSVCLIYASDLEMSHVLSQ